jgi:hypothetical protein
MKQHADFQNFLILGTQRTGSQALYGALNLHPQVLCGGEWTFKTPSPLKLRKAEEALSGNFNQFIVGHPHLEARYAGALTDQTRWLGFKILFRSSAKWLVHPALAPALWVDRLEGHLRWLRRHPEIHVIQLIRRDPVEWLKSKYLGRAIGHTHKTYPEGFKVRIPIGPALRAVGAKRWVDQRISELAETNSYILVNYEDFLSDNLNEVRRCFEFLGCDVPDDIPAGKSFQRQSRRGASEYIENYDELVDALERAGAWPAEVAP